MSAQQTSAHGAPASRTSSIAASAGLGVLAAAIGYLVTYVLIRGEVAERLDWVAEWKGVAWFYYEAHMVDIVGSGQLGDRTESGTFSFIAESTSTSADLLYVIPPIVLLLAGGALAYHWGVRDLGEAVVVGAPVTIGYAFVMAIGAVVSEDSGEIFVLSTSASPDLVQAVLLGGILYPVVFATAGAVVTALLVSR